jgi:hypothetical protein
MFCSTLRRRSSLSPVISSLISPSGLALRESLLETHDLDILFLKSKHLHVLLFTPSSTSDAALQDTIQRIVRLSAKTGGKDMVVVFSLCEFANPNKHTSSTNTPSESFSQYEGMHALSTLQAAITTQTDVTVPIIPLLTLPSLPPLLSSYISSLSQAIPARIARAEQEHRVKTSDLLDLLSLCTVHPPLSQQSVYVITDLVPSLKASARCLTDAGDRGGGSEVAREHRARLLEYLGEETVGAMSEFWREERAVE